MMGKYRFVKSSKLRSKVETQVIQKVHGEYGQSDDLR
jgi:hypothetical protein